MASVFCWERSCRWPIVVVVTSMATANASKALSSLGLSLRIGRKPCPRSWAIGARGRPQEHEVDVMQFVDDGPRGGAEGVLAAAVLPSHVRQAAA